MSTLNRVYEYFHIDPTGIDQHIRKMPIEIPNVGRDDLAKLFGWLGFERGVEIGVEQGKFAEVLCQANPTGHLTCVDAWQTYGGYREHVTQSKLDGFFALTKERLQAYDVSYLRMFSVEAAKMVPDNSLDFVFIDGNHTLEHVIADLSAWTPKVKSGGIISGHDFCRRARNGYQVHVVEAVTAWTGAYFTYPWFLLGSKTAGPGEVRDKPRSFFWVKA